MPSTTIIVNSVYRTFTKIPFFPAAQHNVFDNSIELKLFIRQFNLLFPWDA